MPQFDFQDSPIGSADTDICNRLIEAWHYAKSDEPDDGMVDKTGMWSILPNRHPALIDSLDRRDAQLLASIMSTMFQRHITHGIAMGKTTADTAKFATEEFSANWCDRLVRLGEAVGALAPRSPEQGNFKSPLSIDVQDVVKMIEEKIGHKLVFPNIGSSYGISIHGSCFPELFFSHVFAAYRVKNIYGSGKNIAEIGGGFGGLALMLSCCDYTIFDLPFSNLLQGYFLLKSGMDVSLYREKGTRVKVLPWWEIRNNCKYDVVINQDSIPEMPQNIGYYYISRIASISKSFYSVNQEEMAVNSGAGRQLRVPDIINKNGGYRRVSRNLFWIRDGYVEEVYEVI